MNFYDAARKTQELQRTAREKRRIQKANQEYRRQQQGVAAEKEEETIWDTYLNETTTGGKYSFNRTVEATEWIITGTSPLFHQPTEEGPKRGSLLASKQPPYVHWVCYRGIEMEIQKSEKLACCQEIFRAMLQDPESLCWKTDLQACGYNPNQKDPQNLKIDLIAKEKQKEIAAVSKTEFMHQCTHLLTRIPSHAELHTPTHTTNGLIPIPARWSLVQSPTVLKHKPMNQWRQFVQDQVSGIWIKRSDLSPIYVARPMHLNATNTTATVHELLESTGTFPVFLTSKMVASDENDEWRVLQHTLQLGVVDDPSPSLSAQVAILLFLPNEIRLISHSSKPLSECSPDCRVSVVADTWSADKASAWGQPSVVALQVDIPKVSTRKLSWTTTLVLEDEEQLVIVSPLLYSAVMTSSSEEEGDDRVWKWDGIVTPVVSMLLTDLEEKERLQDLWKVEL